MRTASKFTLLLVLFPLLLSANTFLPLYDAGDYKTAAQQLQKLKEQDPVEYISLPYALLHAKSLHLAGDLPGARIIYEELAASPRFAPYCLLPLARIYAGLEETSKAIASYQSYLRNTKYPDYLLVSLEALNYCMSKKHSEGLLATAQIVQKNSATHRTGQFYVAQSYRLRDEDALARSLLLSLLQTKKADDITNRSLSELDSIDGNKLSEADRSYRGRLAYDAWNFELAVKYLTPLATQDMEYSYYLARSLFFQGRLEEAKKVFQVALGLWPDHKLARTCMYQYANVCLRSGDYETAEKILAKLKSKSTGTLESSVYKTIHALRSQSKLEEALKVIEPYCNARSAVERNKAIFLRARIYFQSGKYREALTDFSLVAKSPTGINSREVLFWKALTLEKLEQPAEAVPIFKELATGHDYIAILAGERHPAAPTAPVQGADYPLCRLPADDQKEEVQAIYESGEMQPALLYLHLYPEAAKEITNMSNRSWELLEIDPRNRLQRFLGICYLAGLGGNYATATYYSELFLKALPKSVSAEELPQDILKALFPLPYKEKVDKFSSERNLDPFLVLAIMKQESKFKQFARSGSFALGLMQLIPPTAIKIAGSLGLSDFNLEQLYQPETNINLGTKFLQDMVDKYGNRIEVIAAGYNSGEANVSRWLDSTSTDEAIDFFSNIDLPETRNYVMLVKTHYDWYRRVYGSKS